MKMFIVLAALIAVALAAPQFHQHQQQQQQQQVYLTNENPSNNIGLGDYRFSFEQSDGQRREESAQTEVRGPEQAVHRVRGSFSWVNPEDGQTYTISYIADENGFQPQGAHLPVAPVA